jgi:pimeloyl-ACP methyl ester carboxylesterase
MSNMLQEERFFFEHDGAQIYGVLHHPAAGAPAEAGRVGFVLCHPLLDFDLYEVPWSLPMIANYSRELARAGHPALRFDFRGAGQSDGEFEDLTLSSCVGDLRRTVDELVARTGAEEVVLIGTRLGATIAMRVGGSDPRVRRMVLWDPVPDPHGSLQGVFRRGRAAQLAMGRTPDGPSASGGAIGDGAGAAWANMQPGQGRLDAGGYIIGQAFQDELKSWDSDPDVRAFRGQVLILQLVRGWSGAGGLRRALINLADAYGAAGAEAHLAEAMDVHPAEWFKQPDYQPVLRETTNWLAQGPAALAR